MTQLITLDEIRALKPLSVNLNEAKKVNPFILEAQQCDLKELLGDKLFVALVADYNSSPSLQVYGDLWNGSTYTYDSNTYRHEGLKTVLIYYAYARISFNSNFEATAHGTRIKKEEYSEPVDVKHLQYLQDSSRSIAYSYWVDVELFMKRNESDYELFFEKCEPTKGRVRISYSDPLRRKYGNK